MIIAAVAATSLMTLAACKQQAAVDPVEGTWKADVGSVQMENRADAYLLRDGQFSCTSCVPPVAVAADGQPHATADQPYYDSMSVSVVDDHTVKTDRKKGDRDVGGSTYQVSADGKSMTVEFTDGTTPNAPPVTGKYTETRVAEAPQGAHAMSGSWKPDKIDTISDEGLVFSYDIEGDTVKMSSPAGQSYSAKVGGPDAAVEGDTSGMTVAVTKPAPNTLVETFKRAGKVVGVQTSTVGADGKMTGVYENKEQGSTTRYTASKQS
jgi:hypothetical protein